MRRSAGKFKVKILAAVLGLGLIPHTVTVHADSLVIQPEQLTLSKASPLANLNFRNNSGEEVELKFDVVQWQQQDDREWLTRSREIIIVPDRLSLKPGASGKVRVGLRLSGSFWDEEAFRILVTEKIQTPTVRARSANSSVDRISRPWDVPVFLVPPGKAHPRLYWSFKRNEYGGVVLHAKNSGKAHIQFHSASLLGPHGEALQRPRMTDILLPGGARSWEFTENVSAGNWNLIAETCEGPVRVKLELEPGGAPEEALTASDLFTNQTIGRLHD